MMYFPQGLFIKIQNTVVFISQAIDIVAAASYDLQSIKFHPLKAFPDFIPSNIKLGQAGLFIQRF